MRPISATCGLNSRRQAFIRKRILSVLPHVIDLIEVGEEDALFLDEAVFTTSRFLQHLDDQRQKY